MFIYLVSSTFIYGLTSTELQSVLIFLKKRVMVKIYIALSLHLSLNEVCNIEWIYFYHCVHLSTCV